MSHIVVTKAERNTGQDAVTVYGTVDGVPTQVQVWYSHLVTLGPNPPNKQAMLAYVAPLLKTAAQGNIPGTVDITGSTDV